MRRVLDHPGSQQKRDNSDGNVDIEDPAPAIVVGNEATERRTDGGRDDYGHAVNRESHAAFFRRECIRQDGLLARLQASSAGALQNPK